MGGTPHTPMCDRRLPCVDLNGIPHLAAMAQPLVGEFIDEQFTVAADDVLPGTGPASFDSNATATQQFGIIRLNAEQRLLLAALVLHEGSVDRPT